MNHFLILQFPIWLPRDMPALLQQQKTRLKVRNGRVGHVQTLKHGCKCKEVLLEKENRSRYYIPAFRADFVHIGTPLTRLMAMGLTVR